MKAIVAVDKNWGIGKDGNLLIRISEDMKRFKNITYNNAVIMGRKTMESIGYEPLPHRLNIVLSRNYELYYPGFIYAHNKKELMGYLNYHNIIDQSFVIGGGEIYKLLLPECDSVIVTKVEESFDADTYFPNLDKMYNWYRGFTDVQHSENNIKFTYINYMNIDHIISKIEKTSGKKLFEYQKRYICKMLTKNLTYLFPSHNSNVIFTRKENIHDS